MKIIVWLGNPGKTYERTRHNVGFFLIDELRITFGFSDWAESRFSGLISEGTIDGDKIILFKPTTFMNLSGDALSAIIRFYRIDPETDLLVISDDIDMEFAKVRMRQQWSHGGQNGLRDIIQKLGTDQFARIKVGIGRDPRYDTADWVLSRFSPAEQDRLVSEVLPIVVQKISSHIAS